MSDPIDIAELRVWYNASQGRGRGDPINHPAHYCLGGIEVIDFIEAKALGYHLGNVVKYVARAAHKGKAVEDLQKARWYLDQYIARLAAAGPDNTRGQG